MTGHNSDTLKLSISLDLCPRLHMTLRMEELDSGLNVHAEAVPLTGKAAKRRLCSMRTSFYMLRCVIVGWLLSL